MVNKTTCNRRAFMNWAARGIALPYIVPASVFGAGGAAPPSERITIGCIGVGGRCRKNMMNFMGHPDCRLVAVCDVDRNRLEEAARMVRDKYGPDSCRSYHDYRDLLARDDIDAVLIASPDQWHVIQSVEAARAGKDIFLEKPLGLSVREDIALRDAVERYERVFQFGTQQRSDRNFRFACELVHNGRIGRLRRIVASVPASRAVDSYGPTDVPPELDYEMWVGPARWMPYTQGVVGTCGRWGHVSNFSLGWVTTWGIHHADIAQWGNDCDRSGPVRIEGSGVFPNNGLYDCATAWDMKLTYANGVVLHFVDNAKHRQGVRFEGTDGWVFVKRGAIEANPKSLLSETIGPGEKHLAASNDHWRNFLDCVRSRRTPVSSIDAAVRSDTVCHLSDIAMRLGRPLQWDPDAEDFVNDPGASGMLLRSMRAPWRL